MIPEIVEIAHREIAVIQTAGKPQNMVVERRQVEVVEVARQGPPGPASPVGGISADDGNALTSGGDGGLYVPDAAESYDTDLVLIYRIGKLL